MIFMKKDELEYYEQKYGINTKGLSYPARNKEVFNYLENLAGSIDISGVRDYVAPEEPEVEAPKPVGRHADEPKPSEMSREEAALKAAMREIEELKMKLEEAEEAASTKAGTVQSAVQKPAPESFKMPDLKVIISPEMASTKYQLMKYEEELGEAHEYEDVTLEDLRDRNATDGTYKIKEGSAPKKVVAQSTLPKENAGIEFDLKNDIVPVVSWMGRSGYLYTHPRLPCIKRLMIDSGYYPEFRKYFDNKMYPGRVWYAANKLLVCDRNVADWVLREIEKKAAQDAGI